jgi:hypothetical protein
VCLIENSHNIFPPTLDTKKVHMNVTRGKKNGRKYYGKQKKQKKPRTFIVLIRIIIHDGNMILPAE